MDEQVDSEAKIVYNFEPESYSNLDKLNTQDLNDLETPLFVKTPSEAPVTLEHSSSKHTSKYLSHHELSKGNDKLEANRIHPASALRSMLTRVEQQLAEASGGEGEESVVMARLVSKRENAVK